MVTVTPTRRYVLVRMHPLPTLSEKLTVVRGGWVTYEDPETGRRTQEWTSNIIPSVGRATVERLGPECRNLKVGDVIVVNRYLGVDMEDDLKLINEQDVLGTVPA